MSTNTLSTSSTNSSQRYASALLALRSGGVIAFPTETVYGLGCDPRNREAVERIFHLKGRSYHKPLLLVASSFSQVQRVAVLRGNALKLANAHWPGPLTLILPVRQPTELVSGVAVNDFVSIRVSSSPVVRALARSFGFPIVATSANRSGMSEARSVRDVEDAFGDEVDAIVDGGTLSESLPSTVARVLDDGSVEVIRDGVIKL